MQRNGKFSMWSLLLSARSVLKLADKTESLKDAKTGLRNAGRKKNDERKKKPTVNDKKKSSALKMNDARRKKRTRRERTPDTDPLLEAAAVPSDENGLLLAQVVRGSRVMFHPEHRDS